MPPITKPSVRLLYLANELRKLREHADVKPKDVCAALGISQPTFSRIESATTAIPPARVETLLGLYGAPVAKRAELMLVAREASKHGLWQGGADIWRSGYVDLERDADEIFASELAYVPGLVQTVDYYRALIRASANGPQDPDEIDRRVAGRMGRQSLMTRDNPPDFHAVMGEAAVRHMVGGPAVMKKQILALCDAADRPNVTLQVVPFAAGAFPGMEGSFTVLTFGRFDMRLGYTEGPGGHIYLESAADLSRINLKREGVLKAALSPNESVDLLRKAADSLLGVICSQWISVTPCGSRLPDPQLPATTVLR